MVINDHSNDATLEICRKSGLNVVDLPMNLGIGGAVQTGYMYAMRNEYDLAVQFDGDGQHDASFLGEMAKYLAESGSNMVIGSRFINKEGFQSSAARRIGIRYFSWLIKVLTGQKITDPTSGMRMCDRRVIRMFADNYPKDYPEPETAVKVIDQGCKVTEIPVRMKAREGGVSSISPGKSVYYMIKVTLAIIIERIRGKVK